MCVCVYVCVCGGLGLTCSKLSLLFSFRAVKFIMPRCACASKVYGSVFVCLCVCVCIDCYSCSKMNKVQVRVSIGF